jgi:putative peptide zinc metalloprotease protein
LSDLLEIPNLSGKASALLSRTAGRLFLGLDLPPVAHLPPGRNGLLLAYAVASGIYRWLVVWSIVFFLNELFKPYHLEIVGHALGMISLVGLVGVPLWRLGRFFSVPGRLDLVETVRLKWTVLAAGALLAAAWLLPLPFHVFASFEVEPHGAANLYTEVPGELVEVLVKPGDQVKQGQLLGRLRNVDVQLEFEQLRGRRDQLESQLRSLRFRRFSDDMAALQVPEVERALEAVERQLVDRQRDLTRLELRAPRDGTVLPPPEVPQPPYDEGTLPRWSGSPFEPHNRNCWMSEQDIFCTIGDPAEMHALVVVEQSEVVYLGEQMVVDLKLDARPGATYRGGILEISSEDVKISPRHLSNKAGGELATKTDASGVERPLTTSYHVLVYPLIDERGELRIGQRGQAKIYAHWQPVGARLWRWFCRTFQFRL